jgi:hypothetical protein
VRSFAPAFLAALLTVPAWAANPLFERAWNRLTLIESGGAKPGSTILFTPAVVNAWARERLPQEVDGLRDPRFTLGAGVATFAAQVDFLKMRQGEGSDTNAMLGKLLEGERPVKVTAHLECAGGGFCTAHLNAVEINGVALTGAPLDLMLNWFFLPMFPNAKINQPFELRENMDRIDIRPDGVRVRIKR